MIEFDYNEICEKIKIDKKIKFAGVINQRNLSSRRYERRDKIPCKNKRSFNVIHRIGIKSENEKIII